ncbi:hypothetical protein BASA83_006626 [Batrachochytrium salamandrivorans]|nr:hypothetical protein BASA83_006626 [Batrachochytrium salamandrivorans]
MYADDVAVFATLSNHCWLRRLLSSNGPSMEMQFGVGQDHSAWLKQKRSALEHAILALHPVLANHQLTVNYRSRIFSAWSWAKPIMGSSWLVATSHTLHHCRRQSTRVSDCSLVPDSRLPLDPFWCETGIGSLLTRSLVSRGSGKIPALVLVSSDQTAIQKQILADTTSQTKDSQATTSFALMEDSCIAPKVCHSTIIGHFWVFKDPSLINARAHGTKISDACAHGAIGQQEENSDWHTSRHPPILSDRCILCDQQLLSTSRCSSRGWGKVVNETSVTGHRIQSGLVPAIQKSRLRYWVAHSIRVVENVYTWLRGGVLNGEADLDQRWLDGTVEHESMGTRHDNRALAARLADFLQVAYRQYQSTLWKYHRDRLVEVG